MATSITKAPIGKEDISYGSGIFSRATSTGGTQNINKVPSGVEVFNVKDYGATGDGATDDLVAIQAAIAAAALITGGSVVFFPPGTYIVSGAIEMTQTHQGLMFMGVYKTTEIRTSAATHIFNIEGKSGSANFVNKVLFKDLAIRGNLDTTNAKACIHTKFCDDFTFQNCHIRGSQYGLHLEDSGNIKIVNNTFPAVLALALKIEGAGESGVGYQIMGNQFLDHADSIEMTSIQQSMLDANIFVSTTGTQAIKLNACRDIVVGTQLVRTNSNGLDIGLKVLNGEGISVTGGNYQDCDQSGINWEGCNSGNITGVMCMNNGRDATASAALRSGIYITNSNDTTICGCSTSDTDAGTQQYGIYEDGTAGDNRIVGCVAKGNGTLRFRAAGGNTRWLGNTDDTQTFTDQDATPFVGSSEGPFQTANTVATTITNFDGGFRGQQLTVVINDANTTINFSGSSFLKGNTGADWSPTTGDHMTCVRVGSVWYCDVSDNTV